MTPPGLIISHTDTQVSDNDAHTLANYTVTYQLSQGFITNRTALYIWPPLVENNQHLDSVKCCINHLTLSANPFSFCDTCVIFNDAFKFSLPDGIELKPL